MDGQIAVLYALLLLFLKHFICDFPLQVWTYQYDNKGTYGHPGGLIHASIHIVGTFLVFIILFGTSVGALLAAGYLAFIDGIIHYHIDFIKMIINKKMKWAPNTHHEYWVLLGFDQFLHALTYLFLIYLVL